MRANSALQALMPNYAMDNDTARPALRAPHSARHPDVRLHRVRFFCRTSLAAACCLALLAMVGCTAVVPWEMLSFTGLKEAPIEGALVDGNSRPPVLRRCLQARDSYAQCDYAFQDSAGNKVNIYRDLLPALDAHAEQIGQLKPWINKVDAKNAKEPSEVPYKMFLLTISPAIVLVVPVADGRSGYYKNRNCSTLLWRGCLQSQAFRGNAYWFTQDPPIARDAFWFTTAEQKGSFHGLGDEASHDISVGGSNLRLVARDEQWVVQRAK
jgi:hypothetical protein